MDDILVYTEMLEEHREVVKKVLQVLKDNNLWLKPEKCVFEALEVEYMGMIVSKGQIRMDPKKMKAVQDWPTPSTVKGIQSFLGFCNFY